jgi:CheY-like chemotaxis protein
MCKKNLLLIDDEAPLTRMLKLHLEDTGKYIVHEINDGTKATSAAKEIKPDLILLDLMMPNIRGEDIAMELMEDAITSNIKLIFLSAKNLIIDNSNKHLKSIHLLSKPIKIDILLKILDIELEDINLSTI